jgi:serine/threonine protein kinase
MHRDIKGANVMLSDAGGVKLTDFGEARLLEHSCTLTGEVASTHGSPAWMAPEVRKRFWERRAALCVWPDPTLGRSSLPSHRQVIRGEKIGRKSDVWSLGCLAVEVMTGQPPWAQLQVGNSFALMYHIAQGDALPAFPDTLSPLGKVTHPSLR